MLFSLLENGKASTDGDDQVRNFFLFFLKILFIWERECAGIQAPAGGRAAGEGEDPKSIPSWGWSPTQGFISPWSHHPEITIPTETKSQLLNQLSHAGAPKWGIFLPLNKWMCYMENIEGRDKGVWCIWDESLKLNVKQVILKWRGRMGGKGKREENIGKANFVEPSNIIP